MSSQALLHNIGDKNWVFDIRLTINYLLARIISLTINYLDEKLKKLTEKVVFRVEEITLLLIEIYKKTDQIDKEEAQKSYPIIVKLRKTITKQNNRYADIDYANNKDLKKAFINLVRLVNRLEAKLHGKIYDNHNTIEAPSYIKEKMSTNGKKIISNALLQEENY